MARNVIVPAPYDEWLTIAQAAAHMSYQAQYTRTLVTDGKLGKYGESVVKLDMGGFQQWRIDPRACDAYKANVGTSGFGVPGVRRFTIRFHSDHLDEATIREALQTTLGDPGVEGEDSFRYEFAPAWKGQKGKKSSKPKPPKEAVVATIVQSLTQGESDQLDLDLDLDIEVEATDDPLA